MLSIVLNLIGGLYRSALRRSVRRMILTGAFTLLALMAWMVAAGFGLSLAFIWLQSSKGTMLALAIISGGCAVLGLISLFVVLLARRQRPWRNASELSGAAFKAEHVHVERVLRDVLAALQGSTQESILAAAALALVTGIMLGRRL